jgi:hypothetical protein
MSTDESSSERAAGWDELSLLGKLASIASEIERFPKTQSTSGRGAYRFAGIDAMADAIRPKMAERGIVLYPTEVELIESQRYVRERTGSDGAYQTIEWRTVLRVTWVVADDSDAIKLQTIGEALDTSDKSANKAQTASRKYALIGLLNITTGDDPDPDHERPGEHVEQRTSAQPAARQQPAAKLPDVAARELFRDKLREVEGLSEPGWREPFVQWLSQQTSTGVELVRGWVDSVIVDDELPSWPPVLSVELTERTYDVLASKARKLLDEAAGAS